MESSSLFASLWLWFEVRPLPPRGLPDRLPAFSAVFIRRPLAAGSLWFALRPPAFTLVFVLMSFLLVLDFWSARFRPPSIIRARSAAGLDRHFCKGSVKDL